MLQKRVAQWRMAEAREARAMAAEGPLSPEEAVRRAMRILDFAWALGLRPAKRGSPTEEDERVAAMWAKWRRLEGVGPDQ